MSEKEASNVITAENAGEFYAQKLGLAETVEETPVNQSEPEAQDEPKATEEPKPNKLEKRFSDITKQRELARQEAERERTRASELEAKLKDLEQRISPPKVDFDAEPKPEQFQDAFEYAKALAEFTTEKALQDRDRQDADRRAKDEQAKRFAEFNKRQEAIMSKLDDYEDMIASSDVVVGDEVRDAIFESEVGPQILYELASKPELAEKLNKLSVAGALREIGKMEARLETPPEEKVVAQKSNAPKPINPLKSTTAALDTPIDSKGEFYGTARQWREMRKAGKIK